MKLVYIIFNSSSSFFFFDQYICTYFRIIYSIRDNSKISTDVLIKEKKLEDGVKTITFNCMSIGLQVCGYNEQMTTGRYRESSLAREQER